MLINLLAQAFPEPQAPASGEAHSALEKHLRHSSWWARLQQMCKSARCEPLTKAAIAPRLLLLERTAQHLEAQVEAFAQVMAEEGGRSLIQCRVEAQRSVQTVRLAAEALHSFAGGGVTDLSDSIQPGAAFARTLRFPVGPVGAVVPFNFPLNLGLHKLAPALALGVPFVCKPPSSSVRTFELLHQVLVGAGWAETEFAIVFVPNHIVIPLFDSLPIPIVSFTGSRAVGESIRKALPDRQVLLELGSTAACILDASALQGQEREKILSALTKSAFAGAGQSCISLQHLLVPASLAKGIFEEWMREIQNFLGNSDLRKHPHEHPAGFCPMVSQQALQKAKEIVEDARTSGLTVWEVAPWEPQFKLAFPTIVRCDWKRPVLLPYPKIFREEVFAPVVCLHEIPDERFLEHAVQVVRLLDCNLHASIYTSQLAVANQVFSALVGVRSVLWNLPPSWRSDAMPYGGAKLDAGGQRVGALLGDEGPKQALRDFSVERLLVYPAGAQ